LSFKILCEHSAWIEKFSPCNNLESLGEKGKKKKKRKKENENELYNALTNATPTGPQTSEREIFRYVRVYVTLSWPPSFIGAVKLHTRRKTQG
jgi:hypothetical protein